MDWYNSHQNDLSTYSALMESIECRKKLGAAIKSLREEQGLSQRAFSLMVGVNRSHLENIESGKASAGIDVLCRIADGLGIKVRDLIEF